MDCCWCNLVYPTLHDISIFVIFFPLLHILVCSIFDYCFCLNFRCYLPISKTAFVSFDISKVTWVYCVVIPAWPLQLKHRSWFFYGFLKMLCSTIMQVNDEYMKTLETLSKKIKFIDADPMVKSSKALKDVQPEVERLRQKAVSKVWKTIVILLWLPLSMFSSMWCDYQR